MGVGSGVEGVREVYRGLRAVQATAEDSRIESSPERREHLTHASTRQRRRYVPKLFLHFDGEPLARFYSRLNRAKSLQREAQDAAIYDAFIDGLELVVRTRFHDKGGGVEKGGNEEQGERAAEEEDEEGRDKFWGKFITSLSSRFECLTDLARLAEVTAEARAEYEHALKVAVVKYGALNPRERRRLKR